VDDHQAGVRDYSAPIWTLLMFDGFLRNVLDRADAPALRRSA
jgi:asparagine synthase (glutamine-hydrolysing)